MLLITSPSTERKYVGPQSQFAIRKWTSLTVMSAKRILPLRQTPTRGWAFWQRNEILFGPCCGEKSGSKDRRVCYWPLASAFRRDIENLYESNTWFMVHIGTIK